MACLKIEFARHADANEIAALSREQIEYDLAWKYKPYRIRALIEDTSKNVVVARRGKALAGFGIMTYLDDTANLDLLAVRSRFRREKVGTRIVCWLEKVALTAGISDVLVQVRETNRVAIRFYRELGFHVVDRAPGYYQGKEAGVIMGKSIRRIAGALPGFDPAWLKRSGKSNQGR